jgi:hypothetical protein
MVLLEIREVLVAKPRESPPIRAVPGDRNTLSGVRHKLMLLP